MPIITFSRIARQFYPVVPESQPFSSAASPLLHHSRVTVLSPPLLTAYAQSGTIPSAVSAHSPFLAEARS